MPYPIPLSRPQYPTLPPLILSQFPNMFVRVLHRSSKAQPVVGTNIVFAASIACFLHADRGLQLGILRPEGVLMEWQSGSANTKGINGSGRGHHRSPCRSQGQARPLMVIDGGRKGIWGSAPLPVWTWQDFHNLRCTDLFSYTTNGGHRAGMSLRPKQTTKTARLKYTQPSVEREASLGLASSGSPFPSAQGQGLPHDRSLPTWGFGVPIPPSGGGY